MDIIDEYDNYDHFNREYYISLLNSMMSKKSNSKLVFSNSEWEIIYKSIEEAFLELGIEPSEKACEFKKQFEMVMNSKAYVFPSIYSLIKYVTYDIEEDREYHFYLHLFLVGIYLSAKTIKRYSNTKQMYAIRSICLNWYCIRLYPSSAFVWNELSSWNECNYRDLIKSLNSYTISILSFFENCDADHENFKIIYKMIIDEADKRYGIEWSYTKPPYPSSLLRRHRLSIVDNQIVVEDVERLDEDEDDEHIVDNTVQVVDLINKYLDDCSNIDRGFSLNLFKENCFREETSYDKSIFYVDESSKQSYDKRLISSITVNTRYNIPNCILISKMSGVDLSNTSSIPSIINSRISNATLGEYIQDYRQNAIDYINSMFVHEEDKELFKCFLCHCLTNSNYKKIWYFFGTQGDEGKSFMGDLLNGTFGDIKSVSSGTFFGKDRKNSNEHTEHLSGIDDAGVIISVDSPDDYINESVAKQLSSSDDQIYHRGIKGKSTQLTITAPIKIDSNFRLKFYPGFSQALLNRFVIIELFIKHIDQELYNRYLSDACDECSSLIKKGNFVGKCKHKYNDYLIRVENGVKRYYNPKVKNVDKTPIKSGLLSYAYELCYSEIYENSKTSYLSNPERYFNNNLQLLRRFDVFMNAYCIKNIIQSNKDEMLSTKSCDDFFNLLTQNSFLEKVDSYVRDNHPMAKNINYDNYIHSIESFKVYPESAKNLIYKTIKAQIEKHQN